MRTNDACGEGQCLSRVEPDVQPLETITSQDILSSAGGSLNLSTPHLNSEIEQVLEQVEDLDTQLGALIAIARNLNANYDVDRLTTFIAERIRPFIEFDELVISLLENDVLSNDIASLEQILAPTALKQGLTLRGVASSIKGREFSQLNRLVSPQYGIWDLIDNNWTWVENDIEIDSFSQSNLIVRAFINVPLLCEGRTLGVLHFDSFSPRDWSDNEVNLARLVGEQVAATLHSIQILQGRAEQEAKLSQSLAILQATQDAAAEGICLVDDSWELVSFNQRFSEIWNIDSELKKELKQNGQVMAHVLSKLADGDEFIQKIWELHDHPDASTRDEIALVDGRTFERYSAPAISPAGESFGRIWTFSDISNRKEYEQRLTHQAYHDAVTGLPNRIFLTNHLLAALKRTERNGNQIAILFLDLDRFKVVNDSLGHDQGDQLLIEVAMRLRASLRPGDVAARFGGDEFVVLLENVTGMDDATKVADRIAANMETPFLLNSHEVKVTASIGIMLGSGETDLPEDLLRKADVAMYRAKNQGKAQYQIFSEVASGPTMERLQLELDLHSAIKRQQFEVCYQPIIDLSNGKINSWEALLRWRHPVRGLVSPEQFIPLAEETGQIVPIGAYVLRVACEQVKKWSQGRKAQHVHVNLSAKQFEQRDLVAQVERILRETELPPNQLMLEITETTMMSDAQTAARQLEELKKLGVGIAIDDFGTGYSSLSYLEDFPIDLIKIDCSFIWRLHERTAIVRAITSLGQALDVNVTAEGIETEAQLAQLRSFHCQFGQGYWFSKPLGALDSEILLQGQH